MTIDDKTKYGADKKSTQTQGLRLEDILCVWKVSNINSELGLTTTFKDSYKDQKCYTCTGYKYMEKECTMFGDKNKKY